MPTEDAKLEAVREYLERHCRGWEVRRCGRRIVGDLRKRGYPMSEQALQHHTKTLMLSGLPVCSDDTKKTGGYFIAMCRREMDDYIDQLDKRINGTLTRANCARRLRKELWPQQEFSFSGVAADGLGENHA